MKNANTPTNPLAQRPSLIEIGGHRVPLVGVCSHEPLLRGCDQQAWLERLVAAGLRHVVVPLNGFHEDTCLFARRHPRRGMESSMYLRKIDIATGEALPKLEALYDLEHRDEGVLARLQFLFQIAGKVGVLVGVSLFDSTPGAGGPLRRDANVHGLSLDEAAEKGMAAESIAKLRAAMVSAVDWVSAEARGRHVVWIEIFRGQRANRGALRQLEHDLARRAAEALVKTGEDAAKARRGPWIVPPSGLHWSGATVHHAAPFDVCHGKGPERHAAPASTRSETALMFAANETPARRAAMYQFESNKGPMPTRAALWRTALRGFWPVLPQSMSDAPEWADLAQLAHFASHWVGHGYLRPCSELLAPMSSAMLATGTVAAATDGGGRFYIHFSEGVNGGVALATLPGSYRYYWIDTATGRAIDHGDGIEGGTQCRVPGHIAAKESLLILEQEELPDPLSVW